MPLVRISHVEGKPAQFALQLSQGVHRAIVETFNVPADDYFQIVTDHAASRGVINLVETRRENWSFGSGLAPFA